MAMSGERRTDQRLPAVTTAMCTLMIIVCCVHVIGGAPANVQLCGEGFGRGHTYLYQWSSLVTQQDTRLGLECSITIRVARHECEASLTLSYCHMKDRHGEHYEAILEQLEQLERSSVTFQLHGGEPSGIQASQLETLAALNVKRAILSAIVIPHLNWGFSTTEQATTFGQCELDAHVWQHERIYSVRPETCSSSRDMALHPLVAAVTASFPSDYVNLVHSECKQRLSTSGQLTSNHCVTKYSLQETRGHPTAVELSEGLTLQSISPTVEHITIDGPSFYLNLPFSYSDVKFGTKQRLENKIAKDSHAFTMGGSLVSWLQSMWYRLTSSDDVHVERNYTAMIFGGQIYTFDGNMYKFSAPAKSCSYLLARDFINNNLTIVGSTSTVTVITPEIAVTVELERGLVTVNNSDHHSNVPIQSWNGAVTVKETESNALTIHSVNGITVKCHLRHTYCTIVLSSWYSHNIIGILGSIDGNPNNDLMSRDGSFSFSTDDYLKSYEVSGEKQCQKHSHRDSAIHRLPAKGCRKIWGRRSQLANCFSKIDPQPFGAVCETLSGPNPLKAACDEAKAYTALCIANGVDMPQTLAECARCEVNGLC